jgi:hypothetical protein
MHNLVRQTTSPDLFENPRDVLQSYRDFARYLTRRYEDVNDELGFGGLDFRVDFTQPTGEVVTIGKSTDIRDENYRLQYTNVARHSREAAERHRQRHISSIAPAVLPLVTPKVEVATTLQSVIPEWQLDGVLRQDCVAAEYVYEELSEGVGWRAVGTMVAHGYPVSIEYDTK